MQYYLGLRYTSHTDREPEEMVFNYSIHQNKFHSKDCFPVHNDLLLVVQ